MIEEYDTIRSHSAQDMLIPAQYRQVLGAQEVA